MSSNHTVLPSPGRNAESDSTTQPQPLIQAQTVFQPHPSSPPPHPLQWLLHAQVVAQAQQELAQAQQAAEQQAAAQAQEAQHRLALAKLRLQHCVQWGTRVLDRNTCLHASHNAFRWWRYALWALWAGSASHHCRGTVARLHDLPAAASSAGGEICRQEAHLTAQDPGTLQGGSHSCRQEHNLRHWLPSLVQWPLLAGAGMVCISICLECDCGNAWPLLQQHPDGAGVCTRCLPAASGALSDHSARPLHGMEAGCLH